MNTKTKNHKKNNKTIKNKSKVTTKKKQKTNRFKKTKKNNNLKYLNKRQNFMYSEKNKYENIFQDKNLKYKKNKSLHDYFNDQKNYFNSIKKTKNMIRDFINPIDYINYADTFNLKNNEILKKEIFMFNDYIPSNKIKPYNNFYEWIIYPWIKNVKKEGFGKNKFYNKYDIFRVTQEKVMIDLFSVSSVVLFEKIKKNPKCNTTLSMNNYFKSITKYGAYTYEGDDTILKHMIYTKKLIENFINDDDLYGLLAYLNENEMIKQLSPICWDLNIDKKNPKIYKSHILPTQLPYYDYDLYVENDDDTEERLKYKKFFNEKYRIYTKELFNGVFGKDNYDFDDNSLINIGKIIYEAMEDRNVKNDDKIYNYNIVKTDESEKLYGFDYKKFSQALGYKKVPSTFIVSNLSYLKNIMDILNRNWKNNDWKTWYIYIHIRQQIRFNKKLFPIFFNFYDKYVKGIKMETPIYIMPTFMASLAYNKQMSEIYEKYVYSEQNVNFITDMFLRMKHVFIKMINECEWMTPNTKKQALLKLEYLQLSIGSSKKALDDPKVFFKEKDVWYNLNLIYNYRKNFFISIDGKTCDKDIPYFDWTNMKITGRQVYTVNAFYTPTRNDIFIPLALLEYPFMNVERSIEINLSHIGFPLCHEMAHCLDNNGRLYDYLGKLNNWWTPQDIKVFEQKQNDIIKQYKYFTEKDGIVYDTFSGLGEDIADIIGLKLCSILLRNEYQTRFNYAIQNKYLSYVIFFINFALFFKQHIEKKSIENEKIVNVHPLSKYRVNISLSRLEIFRKIFDVKKGDGMWWHNTDSIY